MNKIVIASNNLHKIAEITPVLQQANVQFCTQQDFFNEEVIEDGTTFLENALKKARFASKKKTGLPALGDDSGIMVDILDGKPGIFSARYSSINGKNTSDSENAKKLLADLSNYPKVKDRSATYICVMVYVKSHNDMNPLIGIGELKGDILQEPRSVKTIGYDGIMWIPQFVKTMAEVPFAKKIKISHRTQALTAIITQLKNK